MDDSAQKPGPKPGKGMGDSAKKLEDKSQRKLRQGHPVRVTKPRVFKPPVKAGIGGGNGKPFWV
jgi:hypothetical protein